MTAPRAAVLRAWGIALVVAGAVGALLATRVGALGALGTLAVAAAVVAGPAAVFVRRERARLLAAARPPVKHCDCCDPAALYAHGEVR